VPLVPHAVGAAVASGVRRPALAALVIAVAALAGCSTDSSQQQSQEQGSGGERIGAPVRLASCRDWERASLRQRFGTVREIRKVLGREVGGEGGARGRTLKDQQAYDLFDRACAKQFAKGFKLYKLYSRAAAFSQHAPGGQ
jgi:hypothetical protein